MVSELRTVFCPRCDEQIDVDPEELRKSAPWYEQSCPHCNARFAVLRADMKEAR